jgi:hypothetical protein
VPELLEHLVTGETVGEGRLDLAAVVHRVAHDLGPAPHGLEVRIGAVVHLDDVSGAAVALQREAGIGNAFDDTSVPLTTSRGA